MATLIRPNIVRWLDKNGKRVAPKTKGSRKVVEQSTKWYGQGIPGQPPKKRIPLAKDKPAAQRMLDDIVRDAERGIARLPNTSKSLTLVDYVSQFEDEARLGLAARGNKSWKPSAEQLALVMSRI